jgi:hypothetical protein
MRIKKVLPQVGGTSARLDARLALAALGLLGAEEVVRECKG